jgi:hypothetical protein
MPPSDRPPPDLRLNVRLRPAGDEDVARLWDIHLEALREYVATTWGWDDSSQARRFREHWIASRFQVIERDGRPIGMLAIEIRTHEIRLGSIEVDPTGTRSRDWLACRLDDSRRGPGRWATGESPRAEGQPSPSPP